MKRALLDSDMHPPPKRHCSAEPQGREWTVQSQLYTALTPHVFGLMLEYLGNVALLVLLTTFSDPRLQDSVNKELSRRWLLGDEILGIHGDALTAITKVCRITVHHLASLKNMPALEFIDFDDMFNSEITKGTFPPTVHEIRFGINFNRRLEEGVLTEGLRKVTFGYDFDQEVRFPDNMEEIIFGYSYNTSWNALPGHLDCLQVGELFNKPLTNLPPGLRHLLIEGDFNHPLSVHTLPPNLETLHLTGSYNHPLFPGVLPLSLQELLIHSEFKHAVEEDVLPPNLERFYLCSDFKHTLTQGILPRSLRQLSVPDDCTIPNDLEGIVVERNGEFDNGDY